MKLKQTVTLDYARAGMAAPAQEAVLDCLLLPASAEMPYRKQKPMVIICPGGGYQNRSDREAEPIAMKFLAEGFHTAILRYHVAPARYPLAALELAWSVQTCRAHADEWNILPDQIYVLGFSAGGHLAGTVGTMWDAPLFSRVLGGGVSWRPDGQLLAYPVITMGEFTHAGSRDHLLGPDASQAQIKAVSLDQQVTAHTVPAFLWHTVTDPCVPVENALLYAAALRRNQIPFELHLYETGPHGLATADENTNPETDDMMDVVAGWISLAASFIRRRMR